DRGVWWRGGGVGVGGAKWFEGGTKKRRGVGGCPASETEEGRRYWNRGGCAYPLPPRNTIQLIQGRPPRHWRSHAGFQGGKILANLLIRSQQLAECPCQRRRRRIG